MSWITILVSFALRLSSMDFMRSCESGRGTAWPSSASWIAVASKAPMRIGRYRLPSKSLRMTTGSCVSRSMPSLSTFIWRMRNRRGLLHKAHGSYRASAHLTRVAQDRADALWKPPGRASDADAERARVERVTGRATQAYHAGLRDAHRARCRVHRMAIMLCGDRSFLRQALVVEASARQDILVSHQVDSWRRHRRRARAHATAHLGCRYRTCGVVSRRDHRRACVWRAMGRARLARRVLDLCRRAVRRR